MRSIDSVVPEEFSLDGPSKNPLDRWTYDQALDYADQLDLPDQDWELIHQWFALTEQTNGLE